MSAAGIAILCIGAALVCAFLKRRYPELALGISLAAGTVVLALCLPAVSEMLQAAERIAVKSGVPSVGMELMLRGCGISLIADFAAQICRDAGETALAGRVALGARITLTAMAVPLIGEIFASFSALPGFG